VCCQSHPLLAAHRSALGIRVEDYLIRVEDYLISALLELGLRITSFRHYLTPFGFRQRPPVASKSSDN